MLLIGNLGQLFGGGAMRSSAGDYICFDWTFMLRDIDYAASAVQRAIVEKFGRQNDVQELRVTANENTISLGHAQRSGEGTRDALLAAVRKAESYDQLWEIVPSNQRSDDRT